jgi:hypothetical protein
MEFVIWLVGMALLGLAAAGAAWAFRGRGRSIDRRSYGSEQAARWRDLQQRSQRTPGSRVAVVREVHGATQAGLQVVVVWTDSQAVQQLWIEQEPVAQGDYLLLMPTSNGVVPRTHLLVRAAHDAPDWSDRVR